MVFPNATSIILLKKKTTFPFYRTVNDATMWMAQAAGSSRLVALNRILTGWSLKCHPWWLRYNWIYLYLIFFPSADASLRLLIKRPELVWLVTILSELFSALFLRLRGWIYLNTPVKGSKLSIFPRLVRTLNFINFITTEAALTLIWLAFISTALFCPWLNIQEKIMAE